MNPAHTILALFRARGELAYEGEGISQIVHGWQCGQPALQAGAPPALQLAELDALMGRVARAKIPLA